jgi:NAD(P)-dependent dehydrogenase (short-subunit alcohol dehydrogenase family)
VASVLRRDLLTGQTIALAGGVGARVRDAVAGVGGRAVEFPPDLDEDTGVEWARGQAPLHTLVYAAAPSFATGGPEGLTKALDQAWVTVRAAATGAQIPTGQGGKIVLIAPPPPAGAYAEAVRAGLENLARTLSVEWARYGITVTAVAPGGGTSEEQLATLITYLASPAGDYFSGCRFDLS